ncbi:MAG: OmpA family protein [Hyphomonadaceae bacterium]|nr:OmpA family protein [Hyphomonadaceae bacterium]
MRWPFDLSPRRWGAWIGGVGLVTVTLVGLFLAPRIESGLKDRVATSLSARGFPGVDVEMHGQRAVLRGIVEDEADIVGARAAALRAAGAGGLWPGGVTSVNTAGLRVGTFERPFAWSVKREASRVVLSGAVPSENARVALMAVAAQAFRDVEAVDDMHVAGGAASPLFSEMARRAVRAVAELNTGEARIIDSQIVIIGDGGQVGVHNVETSLADIPTPFRSRLALTIDGLDVDHPELQGLNLNNGDAETCERAFDRLMERNFITFGEGSAAITPASRGVLNALASVALRCDRFSIEVAGHTDNTGDRAANMDLSRRRADAVAAYLVGQGVARPRLSAHGYGPDRPRSSNATEAGQAANRRIEFYVSG